MITNLRRVVPSLARSGKPTLGSYVDWARAGLLMAYAADIQDSFRRGGFYVAKILQGARPADLPIEQASKFTLAVNAKTAKLLGIAIPASLLALADEVIE
jgi:putative ABC transport system substrate-binding protein